MCTVLGHGAPCNGAGQTTTPRQTKRATPAADSGPQHLTDGWWEGTTSEQDLRHWSDMHSTKSSHLKKLPAAYCRAGDTGFRTDPDRGGMVSNSSNFRAVHGYKVAPQQASWASTRQWIRILSERRMPDASASSAQCESRGSLPVPSIIPARTSRIRRHHALPADDWQGASSKHGTTSGPDGDN